MRNDKKYLVVGNGNVARAFRALIKDFYPASLFEYCDAHSGMRGEDVIRTRHGEFKSVVNISASPTAAFLDLCEEYGLNYLDTAFEWKGDGLYSVDSYAAELREDLRPRRGIVSLHGFGMNPGLVEMILPLFAPDRPYVAVEFDIDTACPSAAVDGPWATWSPQSYFEETYLVPGAVSTKTDYLLAARRNTANRETEIETGFGKCGFSDTIHDETAYMTECNPSCAGAVFLYCAPCGMKRITPGAGDVPAVPLENVPVLHDLSGSEYVGVAFYDGTENVRTAVCRADHAETFAKYGCNGTCWQVACGLHAGLKLLDVLRPGESYTVSSAMAVPELRAKLLESIKETGLGFSLCDNFITSAEIEKRIIPLFGSNPLS